MPATGLVATVHTASTSSPIASTRPTGPGPGRPAGVRRARPSSAMKARSSGSANGRWPGQLPFEEQTRVPMELAWPVSENGPPLGRRFPVASVRSISARESSVPWTCWLTPIPSNTARRGRRRRPVGRRRSSRHRPRRPPPPTTSGSVASRSSNPSVASSTNSWSIWSVSTGRASTARASARSLPGSGATWASASWTVWVATGSTTTISEPSSLAAWRIHGTSPGGPLRDWLPRRRGSLPRGCRRTCTAARRS